VEFRPLVIGAAFGLPLAVGSPPARAAECDHQVASSVLELDGTELGVSPGQTVCILAGERPFLRLRNLVGTAGEPIVVRNEGGPVAISNSDRGYGLTLDSSRYVRITGSGTPNVLYGFVVEATRTGPDYSASCVAGGGKSSDYELDGFEIKNCGFAGIVSKTDPNCSERDLSAFVQYNTQIHHNYIHGTGGEGIYFGSTGFPSREGTCDGQTVDLIPHTHEGVYIHHNQIEDTGWDGAQIGVSPKDCFFTDNRVSRVGLAMEQYQMQGLQIGGGSSCVVERNFMAEGHAAGFFVLEAQNTRIANNVVWNFLDGIYINDRDGTVAIGARYEVLHNTVVGSEDRGVTLFGTTSANNLVANNLIVASSGQALGIGGDVDAKALTNLTLATLDEARFQGAAEGNFALLEGSPAIDGGSQIPDAEVASDIVGAPRDSAPDVGAFEFGAEPGGGSGSGGEGGSKTDGSGGSAPVGGSDEGREPDANFGCSCRVVSVPGPGRFASLLFLGAVCWGRRRPTRAGSPS
jgi:hypothetical protein